MNDSFPMPSQTGPVVVADKAFVLEFVALFPAVNPAGDSDKLRAIVEGVEAALKAVDERAYVKLREVRWS